MWWASFKIVSSGLECQWKEISQRDGFGVVWGEWVAMGLEQWGLTESSDFPWVFRDFRRFFLGNFEELDFSLKFLAFIIFLTGCAVHRRSGLIKILLNLFLRKFSVFSWPYFDKSKFLLYFARISIISNFPEVWLNLTRIHPAENHCKSMQNVTPNVNKCKSMPIVTQSK